MVLCKSNIGDRYLYCRAVLGIHCSNHISVVYVAHVTYVAHVGNVVYVVHMWYMLMLDVMAITRLIVGTTGYRPGNGEYSTIRQPANLCSALTSPPLTVCLLPTASSGQLSRLVLLLPVIPVSTLYCSVFHKRQCCHCVVFVMSSLL